MNFLLIIALIFIIGGAEGVRRKKFFLDSFIPIYGVGAVILGSIMLGCGLLMMGYWSLVVLNK